MNQQTAQPPIRGLRSGSVRATKWANPVKTEKGVVDRPNYRVSKHYRVRDTDEYKETSSFFPDDIPHLCTAAAWCMLDMLLSSLGLVRDESSRGTAVGPREP